MRARPMAERKWLPALDPDTLQGPNKDQGDIKCALAMTATDRAIDQPLRLEGPSQKNVRVC